MEVMHIDGAGRLALPTTVLQALGVEPDEDVVAELTEDGLLIRSRGSDTITERIAAMNLPVGEWEQMEQEIEVVR
jgi:antitoxin component of MazEF toxin-antitoxin module